MLIRGGAHKQRPEVHDKKSSKEIITVVALENNGDSS